MAFNLIYYSLLRGLRPIRRVVGRLWHSTVLFLRYAVLPGFWFRCSPYLVNSAVNDRDIFCSNLPVDCRNSVRRLTRCATWCALALNCVSPRPYSFQLISPKPGLDEHGIRRFFILRWQFSTVVSESHFRTAHRASALTYAFAAICLNGRARRVAPMKFLGDLAWCPMYRHHVEQ